MNYWEQGFDPDQDQSARIGLAQLQDLLLKEGFGFEVRGEDEDGPVLWAVKEGGLIEGLLEKNDPQDCWEIVCYSQYAFEGFHQVTDKVMVWAWVTGAKAQFIEN